MSSSGANGSDISGARPKSRAIRTRIDRYPLSTHKSGGVNEIKMRGEWRKESDSGRVIFEQKSGIRDRNRPARDRTRPFRNSKYLPARAVFCPYRDYGISFLPAFAQRQASPVQQCL